MSERDLALLFRPDLPHELGGVSLLSQRGSNAVEVIVRVAVRGLRFARRFVSGCRNSRTGWPTRSISRSSPAATEKPIAVVLGATESTVDWQPRLVDTIREPFASVHMRASWRLRAPGPIVR